MVAKGVTVDLEELRAQLREAKEKERPNRLPSLREAIEVLLPEIEGLRRARWSDAQIAEWLGKRGVSISPGTLAQYIREARKSSGATLDDTKTETRHKRTSKETASRSHKTAADSSGAKATTATEPPANRPNAATATVSERKEEHEPEPAAVPSGVRTPNPTNAIPRPRRVNDDA